MRWEYTFGKKITLTDYYKSYLHETSYSKSTTTVKGYRVDTETSFFKRNSSSNNVTSQSFSYSSGTATRYSYGSKYSLTRPRLSVDNNTYTQCTIKVYNPNPVSVTYYDRDVNSSGYTTISAYGTITYDYAWSGGIYDTESHTFSGYVEAYQCYGSSTRTLSVEKPYDTKPTLTAPSITILSNTNYSFTVRYTNNASTSVTMYTYNGTFSLSSGGTKDYTVTWSSSSVSLYAWAAKTDYNDSDTTRTTVSRPAKVTLSAPVLSLNNNTYTQCTISVYNPNSVSCTYYDRDLGYENIGARKTITYDYAWTKGKYEQESHTFSGYLTATGYTDSNTDTLSVSKPYDIEPLDVSISATARGSKGGNVETNIDIDSNYEGTWTMKLYSQESHVDTSKSGSGTGSYTYQLTGSTVIGDTLDITLTYKYGTQSKTVTTSCTIEER